MTAIPKWVRGGADQRDWQEALDECERMFESGENVEGAMDLIYEMITRAFDEGVEEGYTESTDADIAFEEGANVGYDNACWQSLEMPHLFETRREVVMAQREKEGL
jgi:hypothetical protein